MKKETISVAMCTFNGARYVRAQLDSIAAQTRPPDELVVCDDCSTDRTAEIVREFAACAPFPVRLHINESNLGSTENFDKVIHLCEGAIIALADQDDVWMPKKLARLAGALTSSPGAGLAFSDGEVVDEDLRPLGFTIWQGLGFDPLKQKAFREGAAFEMMLTDHYVTGATMAFRSSFSRLALPIRGVCMERFAMPHWRLIHDGWIALLIAAEAQLIPINETLIKYRQHAGQQLGITPLPEEPPPPDPVGLEDRAAARYRHFFESEALSLSPIYERLNVACETRDCKARARKLGARIKHLSARAGLPDSRARRLLPVLKELLTLRYFLYSNGAASAVKDLLL